MRIVQNIYHSVDSAHPLILFILILLMSNQYHYQSRALSPPHEHPVDEPTTARA
jgi:hypothetical protein